MIVVFLLTLYAVGGVAVFYWSDRAEMKKEVPYGTFPSLFSLGAIRKTAFAVFAIFGTAIMVGMTIKLVLHQFTLRLAIFRMNSLLKSIGHKKRIRLAAGHKLTWK